MRASVGPAATGSAVLPRATKRTLSSSSATARSPDDDQRRQTDAANEPAGKDHRPGRRRPVQRQRPRHPPNSCRASRQPPGPGPRQAACQLPKPRPRHDRGQPGSANAAVRVCAATAPRNAPGLAANRVMRSAPATANAGRMRVKRSAMKPCPTNPGPIRLKARTGGAVTRAKAGGAKNTGGTPTAATATGGGKTTIGGGAAARSGGDRRLGWCRPLLWRRRHRRRRR